MLRRLFEGLLQCNDTVSMKALLKMLTLSASEDAIGLISQLPPERAAAAAALIQEIGKEKQQFLKKKELALKLLGELIQTLEARAAPRISFRFSGISELPPEPYDAIVALEEAREPGESVRYALSHMKNMHGFNDADIALALLKAEQAIKDILE